MLMSSESGFMEAVIFSIGFFVSSIAAMAFFTRLIRTWVMRFSSAYIIRSSGSIFNSRDIFLLCISSELRVSTLFNTLLRVIISLTGFGTFVNVRYVLTKDIRPLEEELITEIGRAHV